MAGVYDRKKAVDYARVWALSANPNYYHFGGIGGDCTNFISQCLFAGSGVMNYNNNNGWFYNSISSRSPSWTGVGELMRFLLRKENTKGPYGKIVNINQIEEGDIIQLRQNPTHFNHTVIVTKILGRRIYVCAHTNDAKDKPLDQYNYFETMPIHILGVRK